MASTKDKDGEQEQEISVIPKDDGDNDITWGTLETISAVDRSSKDKRNPFANYTAESLQKITINGKPVYTNIKTDPDTGKVISAEKSEEAKKYLAAEGKKLAEMAKSIAEAIDPPVIAAMREHLRDFFDKWQVVRESLLPTIEFVHELFELEPYIKKELEKPEYNGLTFESLLDEDTPAELLEKLDDPGSVFVHIIEAAKAARADAEQHTTAKRANNLEYPIDKINGKAWNLLTKDTGGQLAVDFDMLPKKADLQAKAYYAINFDDLGDNVKITKRLQPFDKRVYIAVSALYNAGNNVITATQIYYAMGGTTKTPAPNQINKINNALSKMTGAKIILDNEQEAAALKRRTHFKYDGSLLPIERMTAFVNGKVTESAIHIFREPPLMTFAKERNEITTINIELLRSPVSKTDNNLSIDDYLIERISRAKHGDGKSCRILYKTIFEHIGITGTSNTDRTARTRAPETVKKLLSHYKETGFIKRYTEQTDGITIYY